MPNRRQRHNFWEAGLRLRDIEILAYAPLLIEKLKLAVIDSRHIIVGQVSWNWWRYIPSENIKELAIKNCCMES